jgi:hypothetical protein
LALPREENRCRFQNLVDLLAHACRIQHRR